MGTLDLSSRMFAANPDVVYTQIDNDIVLMGPEDRLYYGINATGSQIYSLLQSGPMSIQAICNYFEENYEVEAAQCVSDISMFIEEMVAQKIVVVQQYSSCK